MDDITLTIADDVYDYIVDKAIEYNLGARGLRSITEDIMIDAMFELPSSGKKTLCVNLEYAKSKIETSLKLRSA
jgi:ATP-dependent Clp protease ATP-binding subunit ClpX